MQTRAKEATVLRSVAQPRGGRVRGVEEGGEGLTAERLSTASELAALLSSLERLFLSSGLQGAKLQSKASLGGGGGGVDATTIRRRRKHVATRSGPGNISLSPPREMREGGIRKSAAASHLGRSASSSSASQSWS